MDSWKAYSVQNREIETSPRMGACLIAVQGSSTNTPHHNRSTKYTLTVACHLNTPAKKQAHPVRATWYAKLIASLETLSLIIKKGPASNTATKLSEFMDHDKSDWSKLLQCLRKKDERLSTIWQQNDDLERFIDRLLVVREEGKTGWTVAVTTAHTLSTLESSQQTPLHFSSELSQCLSSTAPQKTAFWSSYFNSSI